MKFKTLLLVPLALLSGCSWNADPLALDEHIALIEADFKTLFQGEELAAPLTLEEAMARGIKYNLDQRVNLMEEMVAEGEVNLALLDALPSVDASYGYIGHDDDREIRAEDAATGTNSLPPSIMEEQHRRAASLNFSWNVIDAGLAFVRGEQLSNKALALLERRRQALQQTMYDIRYAYYRAASIQILETGLNDLKARTTTLPLVDQKDLGKKAVPAASTLSEQAKLLRTLQEIMELQKTLNPAKVQLSQLINLPVQQNYTLAAEEQSFFASDNLPNVSAPMPDLERLALIIRPEVRQESLMTRVATGDVRKTFLQTLPGLEGLFRYDYDSNKYLEDENWATFSVGITQSLVRLFTLPVRLEQAASRQRLVDLKRQAIIAAVLAQVHIAHQNHSLAQETYSISKRLLQVYQRLLQEEKPKEQVAALRLEAEAFLARMRAHLAYIEAQRTYGNFVQTLGLDPLPAGIEAQDIGTLSRAIADRHIHMNDKTLPELLRDIKDKLKQAPVTEEKVEEAASPPTILTPDEDTGFDFEEEI